jgi:hypothetical protein
VAILVDEPYPLPEPDFSKGFYMPPLGRVNWEEIPEHFAEDREFYRLLAVSDSLEGDDVVGAMLKWQRADGYAWYLVVNDDPLMIQHVPYGDAWTVEWALIKGLNMDDVRQMVDRNRRMSALFGG